MSTVHIIYEGNNNDINLEDLFPVETRELFGITELSPDKINGEQVKRALSNYFDTPIDEFNELIVEFHKNGNITVRPNAVFG